MDEYCYRYEVLNETAFPIMENVDVAIILVMENSQRLKKDPFLLNLARKTVIQYNKGFRNCDKPEGITKSNQDINHAFMTAFHYTQNLENVIVFEEDAEILSYDIKKYKNIDYYIGDNDYGAISFWSDGDLQYFNDYFYMAETALNAQAIVYSKSKRTAISQNIMRNNYDGHYDLNYLKNILIYKDPLIVQLHPETENFTNWNGGDLLINKITRTLFTITGRDRYKNSIVGFHNGRKIKCYINNNKILLITLLISLLLIAKFYLY